MIPIEGRPVVETRFTQPDLEVTARPVSMVGNDTPAKDYALGRFIENMKGFTGAFDQYAQVQQQQTIEQEQEKALMDSIELNGAKPVLDPSQSAWYQTESMKLFGKAAAAQSLADLQTQVGALQNDPDAIRQLDPAAFMSQWAEANLSGIDDPDVAREVYPTIQSTVPRFIDTLSNLKRGQLEKDLKEQQKKTLDSAYNMGTTMLGPQGERFTPENLWSFIETATPLIGEKAAAKAAIDLAEAAVDGGGLLAAADVLKSRNPRNGWSIDQYLGDDSETRRRGNNLHKFVEEKRQTIQREQEAAALQKATEERADRMLYLKARVEAGETLTPKEMEGLTEGERASFVVDMVKKRAPEIRKQSIAQHITGSGLDSLPRSSVSSEEKQAAWEGFVESRLSAAIDPTVPQQLAGYLSELNKVLITHSVGNTTAKLDSVFTPLNGVEALPPPSQTGGVLAPAFTQALAVYRNLDAKPQLRGYLKQFSPETREFLRVADQMAKSNRGDDVGAFEYAKRVMEPKNIEARNQFVKTSTLDVEKSVYKVLDSDEWFFGTNAGPLVKEHVRATLPAWLETNALTVRDPQVLGKMFTQELNAQFIQLEDPDIGRAWYNPAGWGGNNEKRLFLRPQETQGLKDEGLAEAITMAERDIGEQFKKSFGGDSYRLRSLPGDPKNLMVYVDGKLRVDIPPLPWERVIAFYKTNAAARKGLSVFDAAPPVVSKEKATQQAQDEIDKLYEARQEVQKKSAGVKTTGRVAAPPPSNQLPTGVLKEGAPVGAKPDKSKSSKNERYKEGIPAPKDGALPPIPKVSKLEIPGLPPDLAATLPPIG